MEYSITLNQLKKLAKRTKEELKSTIRTVRVDNNQIKFYNEKNADSDKTPAFVVELTKSDVVSDQTKIDLIENFTFDPAVYDGAENPNLDGKNVLVLKNANGYEFISLTGFSEAIEIAAGDSTKILELEDGEDTRKLKFNISASDGNALEIKDDGLYTTTRIDGAVENNLIVADDKSMPVDSKRTFATDEEVEEMLNEVLGL
ncbi:MAG: hypothetical protein IJP88_06135 [Synergistaceae bacterium]|nr:hypothetical protein [Synergistaceae bacterium]MBR0096740.1 hypothetical protein [Synergistaceae bacterium]